jgi:N-sulfoglucosamine sulfohydrolase
MLSRRDFIKQSSIAAVLGSLNSSNILLADDSSGDKQAKRPNIFMILADDATVWDFGCYGDKCVRTPNIDKLAQEGVQFNNMFTPAPMCAPARAAVFTGLYPMRNGCHPNHTKVKSEIKTVVHYMTHLGYRTILLGKKHILPEANFPFEYYNDDISVLGPGRDLERILANPGDKPLCIFMCKFSAHWDWPTNNHNYDPNTVSLNPYLIDTPETRKLRANYYSKVTDLDIGVGKTLQLLKDKGFYDNTVFLWTTDQGTLWPHERQNIYDAAVKVPFIIRWPKHIKAGVKTDALASFIDLLPTFIELAGGDVDKVVKACGGQQLDGKSLLSILLNKASDIHSEVFAIASYDVLEGYPMRAVRTKTHNYIYNIDWYFRYPTAWQLDLPYSKDMSPVWKSWQEKAKTDAAARKQINAYLFRPQEELYDIIKDPFELNNIADDPNQKAILKEMRNKVKDWMKQQGDDGTNTHFAEDPNNRFIDRLFCRQRIVNIKTRWIGAGGGVNQRVSVELTSPIWTAKMYYTLDGTEPTKESKLYSEPFETEFPLNIKAIGYYEKGATKVAHINYDGPTPAYLYDQMHLKPIFYP